jgi:hypothetical protein
MRLKCIGCEVLARAIYHCAAGSPHIVDVTLLEIGLHDHPAELRAHLQALIAGADGAGYEAVLLAYGLCGQATAGLAAGAIPLIIPRAHDCITLFLGSRARYQDEFENQPGTYWYTRDYFERRKNTGSSLAMGSGSDTDLQAVYGEYVAKYGQENADYLMEVMGAWQRHYRRAAFIDLDAWDSFAVAEQAQAEAARRGWAYERLAGDLVLVRRLLWGQWLDDPAADFLILRPGEKIEMTYDERVIDCIQAHQPSQGEPS